ncbi:hypothetical protein AAY473_037664 [Plecturocebus cupreus]
MKQRSQRFGDGAFSHGETHQRGKMDQCEPTHTNGETTPSLQLLIGRRWTEEDTLPYEALRMEQLWVGCLGGECAVRQRETESRSIARLECSDAIPAHCNFRFSGFKQFSCLSLPRHELSANGVWNGEQRTEEKPRVLRRRERERERQKQKHNKNVLPCFSALLMTVGHSTVQESPAVQNLSGQTASQQQAVVGAETPNEKQSETPSERPHPPANPAAVTEVPRFCHRGSPGGCCDPQRRRTGAVLWLCCGCAVAVLWLPT